MLCVVIGIFTQGGLLPFLLRDRCPCRMEPREFCAALRQRWRHEQQWPVLAVSAAREQ